MDKFISPFLAKHTEEDLLAKIQTKFNRKVAEDALSRDDRLQSLREQLEEGEITQEQYDAAVAAPPKDVTFAEQMAHGILCNFPECSVQGCSCIKWGDYSELTFKLEDPNTGKAYRQTVTASQLATIIPKLYLMFLAKEFIISSSQYQGDFMELDNWDMYGFTNAVQTYFFGDVIFG